MAFKKKWKNSTKVKTYYAWRSMRSRCKNPNNLSYSNYGERGITVCERWINDYDAFVEDMGHAPDGMTLDRIDFDGIYSPSNCRWVDWSVQANNKRNNRVIFFDGKEMTLSQWAHSLNIGVDTLFRRINVYKMPLERALTSGTLVKQWRHGTRQGYRRGCRCDECRNANTVHHREQRSKKKNRLTT